MGGEKLVVGVVVEGRPWDCASMGREGIYERCTICGAIRSAPYIISCRLPAKMGEVSMYKAYTIIKTTQAAARAQ